MRHLYKGRERRAELRDFQREYGKRKGRYSYGAVVGKVKREREAKHRRGRR